MRAFRSPETLTDTSSATSRARISRAVGSWRDRRARRARTARTVTSTTLPRATPSSAYVSRKMLCGQRWRGCPAAGAQLPKPTPCGWALTIAHDRSQYCCRTVSDSVPGVRTSVKRLPLRSGRKRTAATASAPPTRRVVSRCARRPPANRASTVAPTTTPRAGPRDPEATRPAERRASTLIITAGAAILCHHIQPATTMPVASARASQMGLESKTLTRPPSYPARARAASADEAASQAQPSVCNARLSRTSDAASALASVMVIHFSDLSAP